MVSRNVTLALPDELVRKVKVFAAERDTSISALVSSLLSQLVGEFEQYDRMWADEEVVMASGPLRVGPITWTRDDLHRR